MVDGATGVVDGAKVVVGGAKVVLVRAGDVDVDLGVVEEVLVVLVGRAVLLFGVVGVVEGATVVLCLAISATGRPVGGRTVGSSESAPVFDIKISLQFYIDALDYI